MGEHTEDGLLRFFKSAFSKKAKKAQWNTPPDFVFENAMRALDTQPKKRNYMPLLWMLFGALFLSTVLYYNHQIKEIKAELTALQEKSNEQVEIDPKKTALATNEDADHSKTNTNLEKKLSQKYDEKQSGRVEQQRKEIIKSFDASKKKVSERPARQSLAHVAQERFNNKFIAQVDRKHTETIKQKLGIAPLYQIEILDFGLLEIASVPVNMDIPLTAYVPEASDDNSTIKFHVGVSEFFTKFEMSPVFMNKPMMSSDLKGYDKFYTSQGINLGISKSLGARWEVYVDAGYSKVRNKSFLTGDMTLSSLPNEWLDANTMRYSADMEVPTPLGSLDAATTFDVIVGEVSSDESIDYVCNIAQDLQVISFETGVRNKLFETNHVDVFMSAGLGINAVVSGRHIVDTSFSINENVSHNFETRAEDIQALNGSFITSSFGLGLGYKLSNNISLELQAQHSNSLNSIGSTDAYKTSMRQWQSQLGLTINL